MSQKNLNPKDQEPVTRRAVKIKLHRILQHYSSYDGGCVGVDFDWDKIDQAIDKIPKHIPEHA